MYYDNNSQNQGYNMNFNDPNSYPTDPQFQNFQYSVPSPDANYSENQVPAAYENPYYASQPAYSGSIMTPDPSTYKQSSDEFDDEPPLMEELGINFEHICHKTLSVLNPLKLPDASVMQDTDLAGPLVFCILLGATLLLAGKVHFGYIYGIGVVGCLSMYMLLNLMSLTSVSVTCIISVLGYCLLPMVLLSFTAIWLSLQGLAGTVLTLVSVLWCSVSASKLFVSALSMHHQQLLVAYPCALVYGIFALLTVF